MERNDPNDLDASTRDRSLDRSDDRLRDAAGLDRSGAPDSNATRESLVGDSMRAGALRGDVRASDTDTDATLGVDRFADAGVADDLRRDDPNPGDEIGEAVGGISGVLTGAALGSLGGPIGTIIGGIAGAVSGWWAGRAISEAASHATGDEDEYYRTHYGTAGAGGGTGLARPDITDDVAGARLDAATERGRSFDDVRPAYQIGHLASRNPDYHGRSFDDIEPDLRHGWSTDVSQRHGSWDEVRDYARHAYERGRGHLGDATGNAPRADLGATGASGLGASGLSASGIGAGGVGATGGAALGGSDTASTMGGGLGSGTAGAMGGGIATSGRDTRDAHAGMGGTGAGVGGDVGDALTRSAGFAGGAAAASRPEDQLGDALRRTDDLRADRHPGIDTTGAGTSGTSGTSATGAAHAVGSAWDRTKDAASRMADRAGDALDDVRDRVDGDPASRPGVDRTDTRDRLR